MKRKNRERKNCLWIFHGLFFYFNDFKSKRILMTLACELYFLLWSAFDILNIFNVIFISKFRDQLIVLNHEIDVLNSEFKIIFFDFLALFVSFSESL